MFFRQAHHDHQPVQQYQEQAANPQQPVSVCQYSTDQSGFPEERQHAAGTTMTSSSCMQHVLHRRLPPLGPGHHTTGGTGHPTAMQQQHVAANSHHIRLLPQHHQPPPQQEQQHSLEAEAAGRGSGPAGLYSAFKASLMRHDQAVGRQHGDTGRHPSTSSTQGGAAADPGARGPGSVGTYLNTAAAQQQQQQQQGHTLWHYHQHQEYQQEPQQQQQQQQYQPRHHDQHQSQRGQDPQQAPHGQPYGCDALECAPRGLGELECDEDMCNVAFPAPYIDTRGAADPTPATAVAAAGGGGGGAGWAAVYGEEVDTSLYRTSTDRSSVESDKTVYHELHQQRRSSTSQRSLLGRGAASSSITTSIKRSSSSSSDRHMGEEENDCMQVDDQLECYISSAGRRCCIAVMSVYTDINSPVALAQANALMARVKLPGGVSFVPVESEFFLWRAATAWSFPAYATVLASSYFQRLLVALPQLAQAATTLPSLQGYCSSTACTTSSSSGGDGDKHVEATMRSIQVTCLYVALKVADQVHALGLLRFMLTAIGGNVNPVPLGDAELVEARLLDGLGWRLGPFFAEDDLDELGFDGDVWGALE